MKITKTLNAIIIFILIGCFFIGKQPTTKVQAQDIPPKVCLLNTPNVTNWPDVTLDLRAYDTQLNVVKGLAATDFSVQDNGKIIQPNTVRENANSVGLNIYFVVDMGNRTDLDLATAALQRFGEKFMIDGLDQVSVYINFDVKNRTQGPYLIIPPTTSTSNFLSQLSELSKIKITDYYVLPNTMKEVFSNIRSQNVGCSRPTMIVVFQGQDVLDRQNISEITKESTVYEVPINVVHTQKNNAFESADKYKQLASDTHGIYVQATPEKTQEFSQLDLTLFSNIAQQRTTNSVDFRTVEGSTGEHNINVLWHGQANSNPEAYTKYSIRVDPAQVEIKSPVDHVPFVRTAQSKVDNGFVYDNNILPVEFTFNWVDGHPRRIVHAELIMTLQGGGSETPGKTDTVSGNSVKFDIDLHRFTEKGDNSVQLQAKVIDEFGIEASSSPINALVRNNIPPELQDKATDPIIRTLVVENSTTKMLVYGLVGVVIVLLILLLVFWRRLSKMAKSGVLGSVVERVRKTIVGGRGSKPLATLKVLDGPVNLQGKELTINAESVSLGSDPKLAQYTFYTDVNTSISGLHAKIERISGQWRITGLSRSGNETFVDEEPIPCFQPKDISSGQRIRMGYPGQQPVELLFTLPEGVTSSSAGVNTTQGNKTKVKKDAGTLPGYEDLQNTTNVEGVAKTKPENGSDGSQKPSSDDPFGKFRQI